MTKVACCCLLAVALFACSKKSDEGGSAGNSGGGECGDAVNKGMDAVDATRKQQLADRIAAADTPDKKERLEKGAERAGKMAEQLRPILTKHCNEDKWSADSITCMSSVTKREDIQACVQKLPKEQGDKVTQDVMQAMMGGMRMRPPGQMMPHGQTAPMAPMTDHPPMGSAVPGGGSAAPAPAPAGSGAPAGSAAPAPASPATPATPTKTDAPKK